MVKERAAETAPILTDLERLVAQESYLLEGGLEVCVDLSRWMCDQAGLETRDSAVAELLLREFVVRERESADSGRPLVLAAVEFIGIRDETRSDPPTPTYEDDSVYQTKLRRGGQCLRSRRGPITTAKRAREHVDDALHALIGALRGYLADVKAARSVRPGEDVSGQDQKAASDGTAVDMEERILSVHGGSASATPRSKRLLTTAAAITLILLGVMIGQFTARTESSSGVALPISLVSTGGQFGQDTHDAFVALLAGPNLNGLQAEGRFEPQEPTSGRMYLTGTLELVISPQDPCPDLRVEWTIEADGSVVRQEQLSAQALSQSTTAQLPREIRVLKLKVAAVSESSCASIVQVFWRQPKLNTGG